LQTALARQKANINTALYGSCDAVEHGKGMPFIVGIFESGNNGLGGAHTVGKLSLGEAGALAKLKDLVGNFSIGDFLLKTLLASRIVAGDVG